jgi:hypothetical protein
VIGLLLGAALAQAGNPFEKDAVDRALERAAAYLVTKQNKDGWINDRGGHEVVMTSLAVMGLCSIGHQPTDPTPQGEAIRRALDFVLQERNQSKEGYLGERDSSRMYGHGVTSLMLGEVVGMGASDEQDKLARRRLKKAVELILRAQKVYKRDERMRGGWRYEPTSTDSDLSATVWQVMALRSAYNAGLDVPKGAIDSAVEYLRRSYTSPFDREGKPREKKAGFSYQPGGSPQYAATAAGLLSMQVCARYDDPTVAGASDWLMSHKPRWGQEWFYYGTYYYAQGMHQRGGDTAAEARKIVEEILLPKQGKDGSWEEAGNEHHGRVYTTAMAMLSLSVKYHYLPIYQR